MDLQLGPLLALLFALGVGACSDPSPSAAPPVDAGAPDAEVCGAGTTPLDAGGCLAAGVPPERCGEGFAGDGEGGCVALMPRRSCGPAQIAVPGEPACHEIAPCGDGNWGTIPVESNTEFVDAAFVGPASDGSAAKPWKTVQEGIDAAADGAIVAIAAGTYEAETTVSGKAVRLWGRCPADVELVAPEGTPPPLALFVEAAASGTEVHDLAMRGRGYGFAVSASDVVLDRVWVHDTPQPAFAALDAIGPASAVLRRSLIERSGQIGIYVAGAEVTLEQSVVRDTQPAANGTAGVGISVLVSPGTGARSTVTVRGSVIEKNRGGGLVAIGGDAVIETTVVRDTAGQESDDSDGEGVLAAYDLVNQERSVVSITSSVVEANHETGVFVVDSEATLSAVTVRGTLPQVSDMSSGFGIAVQESGSAEREARLAVSGSAVLDNAGAGIFVANTDATVEGVLVLRTTGSGPRALFGDGILGLSTTKRATVVVTASRIESSARAGISSFGSDATVGSSALLCNGFDLDGELSPAGDFAFQDIGANTCGCAAALGACSVLSAGLTPPAPF